MDNNKKYQMKVDQDKLVFITSSFKAEKTSVLHPGVYTKEFASMLFASATCIFAYISTDLASIKSAIMRYIILIVIFVVAFLGANKYIFKERYLEADFNKSDKTVNIVRSGLITKKSEKIPFARIKSVDLGIKKFVPENIDGIDFVQKISAQHGSAIPGLSDIEEFITLSLSLTDGSERIIFAAKINGGRVDGEPEIPVKEIRSFLENKV
jgi:Ca2+/Na+ antiporter